MQRLFAPWRMEFIEGPKTGDCVLCHLGSQSEDSSSLVLHKGKYSFVLMNKFPYSHGHSMVIPFRHISAWTELTSDELLEINKLTQKSIQVFEKVMKPQGFNLGVNLGKAAGAGIADHVHQHVVPRWVGDMNFMPLLSEVKVISEHLIDTYEKLKRAWG